MAIIFRGDVTIYGNVEMYSDGSMKILPVNPIIIPLTELERFVERRLKDSPNKQDYLDAADALKTSTDTSALQGAAEKLKGLAKEIGTGLVIKGIPTLAVEAIKALLAQAP